MTTRGKVIGVLSIILVVGILLGSYFAFSCFSDGHRAGTVIKFSRKGIAFKTYEGELIQRTFSTAPGDTWHFSVTDPSVVAKIEDAMAHGQHVDLTYCQKFFKFFWQGETDYFVADVKVVQ
jgi:hypothetical protein